jgi:hypothetical protein
LTRLVLIDAEDPGRLGYVESSRRVTVKLLEERPVTLADPSSGALERNNLHLM